MRILMVHEDARDPGQGGGAESLLRDQTVALSRLGHEIAWYLPQHGSFPATVEVFRPDIVHLMTIHNFLGMGPALFLQEQKIPHVWHVQDYWPFCPSRMMLVGGDRSCSGVEGVCGRECGQSGDFLEIVNRSFVVAGNAHTAQIYRRNGLRCDAVVELGVDTELFAPAPGLRSEQRTVFTSTAWYGYPTKGMHILAQALRGRPYGGRVITGVSRDRVAAFLKEASVYAFPSCYEETFGLCLCEAMASGCAVVASDVAGARAQVHEGMGVLVEKRNPKALREALDLLMDDPEMVASMGRRAREHAREEHSLEAMARRFERVYKRVLGEKEEV